MALTPRASVPYPQSGDNAVVASDIGNVASFIDTKVPVFVISASQPASPISGMIWWCTSSTALDSNGNSQYGYNWYDGTTWFNVTEQMFMVGTTAPAVKFNGLLWYDTTRPNGQFQYWNGTGWATILPSTATTGQILTSGVSGPVWTSTLPSGVSISNSQVSYSVQSGQSGTVVATSASANNIYVFTGTSTNSLTLPSTSPITAGQQITVVSNVTTGSQPTITTTSSASILSNGSGGRLLATLRANGSVATIVYLGSNQYLVTGDII